MAGGPIQTPSLHGPLASLADAIVLFVDDEPSLRILFGKTLQSHVQAVHTAATAAEAHGLAADLPRLDLLITDARLPDAPGLRLAELLRIRHPRVRVLLISGDPCEDVVRRGMYFMHKPFTLVDLLAQAHAVLQIGSLTLVKGRRTL